MELGFKKIFATSLSVLLTMSLFTSQASAEKREIAKPEMEVRVKGKLTLDGKEFKDLNGNGKLVIDMKTGNHQMTNGRETYSFEMTSEES